MHLGIRRGVFTEPIELILEVFILLLERLFSALYRRVLLLVFVDEPIQVADLILEISVLFAQPLQVIARLRLELRARRVVVRPIELQSLQFGLNSLTLLFERLQLGTLFLQLVVRFF